MPPWLGVVADDLTGACDLAGGVAEQGCQTVVLLGPVGEDDRPQALPDCDCAVVALKSRTAPVGAAVAESVSAAHWLLRQGAERLYQKYCSTFDSTATGNIGPVGDALLDVIAGPGTAVSLGTPATPSAGRTQYQGHLFVGDLLLSESSLRTHPLTPMHDPDLVRVLGRQSSRVVRLVPWATVQEGPGAVGAAVRAATTEGGGHLLADALRDVDLEVIATALLADDTPLIGGAAGLAAAMGRIRDGRRRGADPPALPAVEAGRRLILSGSCSRRTREQIAAFEGPRIRVDVMELAAGRGVVLDRVLDGGAASYRADPDRPILVFSAADPDELAIVQEALGRDRAGRLVEEALAEVAARAVAELGVRRLVVAGGETSGAVSASLGVRRLHVGANAAPGVPWTVTVERPHLALLFKSGNFGAPQLFTTAWQDSP